MSRVLIVCDVGHWAFGTIAQAICKYNNIPDLELDVLHLKTERTQFEERAAVADLCFFMHWSLAADLSNNPFEPRRFRFRSNSIKYAYPWLNRSRVITGIHAHHDWDGGQTRTSQFVQPPESLAEFLNGFKAVNAVSSRLTKIFREAGTEHVTYTPNGVDHEVFRPCKPIGIGSSLRIGYAGTKKRDWKEGITDYIEKLANYPELEVHIATPQENYVPRDRMPEFFNNTDVYVCASRSEGFSLAVLEAAACGRPVVTTRVGGCEELVQDGHNGFFVERDLNAIAERLRFLKDHPERLISMGAQMRADVEERWTWEKRVPDWLQFIVKNL